MAPLPHVLGMAKALWKNGIASRGLGTRPGDASPQYSDQQKFNLQVLALTFSSISVLSALLAFYWFRRMRRSFRHDLIMFLIQSDMFKALWFMIYPIVVFVNGPVSSDDAFCKVNGFFISLGIEASDFAVLMIGLHSALYIFNPHPRTAAGEGGLYPYRHIAFALWIIFPLLMASLAFINDPPYAPAATYCYLPVRPFWYRLALSWIPRYIIFIIILALYAAIYIYVHFKFRDFRDGSVIESASSHLDTKERTRRPKKRHSLPATPPLAYNGLLTESRTASLTRSESGRTISETTMVSTSSGPMAHRGSGSRLLCAEKSSRQSKGRRKSSLAQEWSNTDPPGSEGSNTTPSLPGLEVVDVHPTSIDLPRLSETLVSRGADSPNTAHKVFNSRSMSYYSMFGFLRRQPQNPAETPVASTPISELELVDSHGNNVASNEMQRTREKIRRQLRFMFIYPIVYIFMWILPFISHVLQYNDDYALNPPYVLSGFVVVSICAQAAVDCWLFSTREKPWRHIPGTTGTFLESLKFWEAGLGLPRSLSRGQVGHGPGKSRAEMIAEARMAYQRREEEIAAHKIETEDFSRNMVRGQRGQRDWWEGNLSLPFSGDGAMSTVTEEVSPLEQPSAFIREESSPSCAPGFLAVIASRRSRSRGRSRSRSRRRSRSRSRSRNPSPNRSVDDRP